MENRSKFYTGGLWSKDDLKTRYENICWALDVYNTKHKIDDQELKFIIKNGFVSKIYISNKVYCNYKDTDFGSLQSVYNRIVGGQNDVLGTNIFDICKAIGKSDKNYHTKGIRIEHVIPYNDKQFRQDVKCIKTIQDFEKIFNAVSICLVTMDEDENLSTKGLKQKMPDGINYKEHPFARYDQNLGIGIEVFGWTMKEGVLYPKR